MLRAMTFALSPSMARRAGEWDGSLSHELISVITSLEQAVKELTDTIRESNRLAKEEMAVVTSPEFVERLRKVVDEAWDEAALGREMLDG